MPATEEGERIDTRIEGPSVQAWSQVKYLSINVHSPRVCLATTLLVVQT